MLSYISARHRMLSINSRFRDLVLELYKAKFRPLESLNFQIIRESVPVDGRVDFFCISPVKLELYVLFRRPWQYSVHYFLRTFNAAGALVKEMPVDVGTFVNCRSMEVIDDKKGVIALSSPFILFSAISGKIIREVTDKADSVFAVSSDGWLMLLTQICPGCMHLPSSCVHRCSHFMRVTFFYLTQLPSPRLLLFILFFHF